MSFDKNLFLGIDIGTSSLKIALLKKEKGGRVKLLEAVSHEYTSYPVDEQNNDQSALVAYFLKKFLYQHNELRNGRIGISIAGQSAFVRLVKVPVTAPAKLRQIVLYETQQQVPFPIKDVVWDFQIYDRDKKQLSVLLAAVKKELTASILNVISQFSLNVEFIDVSNLSLFNCLQYFYNDLNQTLVIDCGAKTTNIIVINDGKFWTRSLPLGGQDVTESIAKALDIDDDKAEQLKREKGKVLMLYYGKKSSKNGEEHKIAQAITEVLTDLTNEIVKTLNFYKSQHQADMNFKKVLLTGGLSKIENVDRFFENSLSIEVEKIDYFDFLAFNPKIDLDINEFLGPSIGLALRGLGRSVLNINLLSPEYLQIRDFKKKIPYLIGSCVCFALLLFSILIYNINSHRLLKDYLRRINDTTEQYKQAAGKIDNLNKDIVNQEKRAKALADITNNRYQAVEILSMLTESMPGAVWVKDIEIDVKDHKLVLKGNCGQDLNSVDIFQRQILAKDIFDKVKINTVGKNEDGTIDFSLTISIKS